MPNADKSSFASRTGAMNFKPLDWGLSLILVAALAGQVSLTVASPKQPLLLPVIRQTSSIDCGLAALAMLLRDKASITTSVTALDSLAAVLVDPMTARHRREGYSVSELQTLAGAFAYSLQARNLTLEAFYTSSFPLIAWIDPGNGGHFTLVEEVTATSIALADPTRGRLAIPSKTWRELWLQETTGIVLELE
jgi:ABC-type bacteriocin/lantibiotic exporter with double-glycine peptidase domain